MRALARKDIKFLLSLSGLLVVMAGLYKFDSRDTRGGSSQPQPAPSMDAPLNSPKVCLRSLRYAISMEQRDDETVSASGQSLAATETASLSIEVIDASRGLYQYRFQSGDDTVTLYSEEHQRFFVSRDAEQSVLTLRSLWFLGALYPWFSPEKGEWQKLDLGIRDARETIEHSQWAAKTDDRGIVVFAKGQEKGEIQLYAEDRLRFRRSITIRSTSIEQEASDRPCAKNSLPPGLVEINVASLFKAGAKTVKTQKSDRLHGVRLIEELKASQEDGDRIRQMTLLTDALRTDDSLAVSVGKEIIKYSRQQTSVPPHGLSLIGALASANTAVTDRQLQMLVGHFDGVDETEFLRAVLRHTILLRQPSSQLVERIELLLSARAKEVQAQAALALGSLISHLGDNDALSLRIIDGFRTRIESSSDDSPVYIAALKNSRLHQAKAILEETAATHGSPSMREFARSQLESFRPRSTIID